MNDYEILTSLNQECMRPSGARLSVDNRREREFIRVLTMACGVWDQDIDILAVFHRDVPPQVSRKDFRAAARSANYLQISRVPTNLAEYLGVSVPGMNNADANADACIGNISNIIGREKIQGVLPEFNCGVDACVRLLSVCDA